MGCWLKLRWWRVRRNRREHCKGFPCLESESQAAARYFLPFAPETDAMNQEEIERCFGVEGSSLEQFLQLQEADVVDVAAYPGMFLQVLGGARVESVKQYWRILANVWGKQRDAGTIGPGGA